MESESVLVVHSDSDQSPIGKVGECKDLGIWPIQRHLIQLCVWYPLVDLIIWCICWVVVTLVISCSTTLCGLVEPLSLGV